MKFLFDLKSSKLGLNFKMSIEEQFVEEDLICLRIEFKATVSDVLRSGRLLNLILPISNT